MFGKSSPYAILPEVVGGVKNQRAHHNINANLFARAQWIPPVNIMENNRRPLVVVLGPLLGALLLVLTVNWAASYLREGQEELALDAALEQMAETAEEDAAAETPAEGETPSEEEATDSEAEVAAPVTDTAEIDTETPVTVTESLTGTETITNTETITASDPITVEDVITDTQSITGMELLTDTPPSITSETASDASDSAETR
jgi:hypothetical protein